MASPLKDPKLTAISASLNETVTRIAAERALPVIDLFSAMDPLDREEYWSDTFHFKAAGVAVMADAVAARFGELLGL